MAADSGKATRSWPEWQKHAAWSAFFLAATGFLYWYFVDFESSKESSRSMHWLFATLYNTGGKSLACGVTLAGAVGFAVWAWSDHRKLVADGEGAASPTSAD